MARQYYFKSWNEAQYLMTALDCYEVEYALDCDVDDGGDVVTVFDNYGEGVAEACVEVIRSYPYEQYKLDKAKLVAEGVSPRHIMSYSATLAYNEWQSELDYDEEMERQMREDIAEYERDLRIAAEVAERDELLDAVAIAEENALCELAAFGFVEFEDGIGYAEFGEDDYEPFWDFACDLFDYYDGHWHESYVLESLY